MRMNGSSPTNGLPENVWAVDLSQPPTVLWQGFATHGVATSVDHFRLPELWQLHLYDYRGRLVVDADEYEIRPGMASLIPPGARVTFHYQGRSQHHFAHLDMPTPLARSVHDQHLAPESSVIGDHQISVITTLGPALPGIRDLMVSAVASADQRPSRAQSDIWQVLHRLAELSADGSDIASEYVSAALNWIETHLSEPVTVPEVAAAVGVSADHLTRLFRQRTGRTVAGHLRHRRVEHGIRLLQHSTMTISAIAATVGIADLQAFNKTCRAVTGYSPRALRDSPR